jgi:hypothetical protein
MFLSHVFGSSHDRLLGSILHLNWLFYPEFSRFAPFHVIVQQDATMTRIITVWKEEISTSPASAVDNEHTRTILNLFRLSVPTGAIYPF